MTIFITFVGLARLTAMLAAGTCLLAAADGDSAKDGGVEVPAALNPDKLSIFRVVSATGVQVYTCTHNPAGATGWLLKGPDAQLFDSQNKPVGKHYAGPTWEGLDGGKVVGVLKTSMPAPVDKAVPWLLLNAKSHEGPGSFRAVHPSCFWLAMKASPASRWASRELKSCSRPSSLLLRV